ncbi:MAG: hypothetical protein JXQ81_07715 [Desulfuromonadales bacterium]|nr:hypothetical protein [Desulfuromonadales bacterium]MBN2792374.1 hypothetical protein [Desulfuromonadales bacterium]
MPIPMRFIFCGHLAALVRRSHHDGVVSYALKDSPAVKDAVEACGIPHTEVDLLICDGASIDWTYRLSGGEQVQVLPPGYPCALNPLHHLACRPFTAHFILDVHLGKLARRLRLLGFDCLYRNDYDDREIISTALQDDRIILTSDRGILSHSRVQCGLLIRSVNADEQVEEVLRRFGFQEQIRPFSRCTICNGYLDAVAKDEISHQLLPGTAANCEEFHQCRDCGKLYWRGAHFTKIIAWFQRVGAGKIK